MKNNKYILALTAFFLFALVFGTQTLAQETATDEADSVREVVREKLLSASNKPVIYLGTITDLIEETIQIENQAGEIQQVSVTEESTSFVQVNSDSKSVELEDVGIGDFIVALGYVDENEVLDSSRVLITDELGEPERQILTGEVVDVDKKDVTIKTSEGEILITFPRRWKGPEISELEVGSSIIVVVIPNEDAELEVRTIQIASEKVE